MQAYGSGCNQGAALTGENFLGAPVYRQAWCVEICQEGNMLDGASLPAFISGAESQQVSVAGILKYGGYAYTGNNQERVALPAYCQGSSFYIEVDSYGKLVLFSTSRFPRSQAPAYIWVDFIL